MKQQQQQQFELQLPELLYFVKESCHESLHDTIKEVGQLTDQTSRTDLTSFVKAFIEDLKLHLSHEENTLFPSIASGRPKNHEASISHLLDDHEQMRMNLLTLRQMTENYQLEDELMPKLQEMDRIILNHIQIEDHILFPMVLKTS
jgi:iron-sulfur cluster repair protein YtfE (RIC family)